MGFRNKLHDSFWVGSNKTPIMESTVREYSINLNSLQKGDELTFPGLDLRLEYISRIKGRYLFLVDEEEVVYLGRVDDESECFINGLRRYCFETVKVDAEVLTFSVSIATFPTMDPNVDIPIMIFMKP